MNIFLRAKSFFDILAYPSTWAEQLRIVEEKRTAGLLRNSGIDLHTEETYTLEDAQALWEPADLQINQE